VCVGLRTSEGCDVEAASSGAKPPDWLKLSGFLGVVQSCLGKNALYFT
jgi:hypothetical protein